MVMGLSLQRCFSGGEFLPRREWPDPLQAGRLACASSNRNHLILWFYGGGERVRTDDLLRARQALSQLSYTPVRVQCLGQGASLICALPLPTVVGLDGVEPSTSRLSGVRSNQTELQAPSDFGSRYPDLSFQIDSKIQLSPSFISIC